ncbi:MAG: NTP transferase domain-containing protein, partial [Candidatus Limnocylindrales bacterium]
MTTRRPTIRVVILAAGLGTRMRSRRAKVLHPLCGRPMLGYVIEAAVEATGGRPLVLVSPATEAVRGVFADQVDWAVQDPPLGTGHALQAAMSAVHNTPDDVVVLSGDTPLLTAATITQLIRQRQRTKAAIALGTIVPEDATGYGRIVRDGGDVARIVEDKDASKAERAIEEVNGGLYAFDGAWLRTRLNDLTPSPATGELYLTELVALARGDGRSVVPVEVDDEMELAGVNDRVQLATLEADLRWRILERHLLAGVTMEDPGTTFVDADVEIGQDVVLEPNVLLRGHT